MKINAVISYLDAWEELNNKYKFEYCDIISALEELESLDEIYNKIELDKKRTSPGVIRYLRQIIQSNLVELGWTSNPRVYLVTKNMVAIDIMRGLSSVDNWLFRKSNLAVKDNLCELPILMIPMKDLVNGRDGLGTTINLAVFEQVLFSLKKLSPLFLNTPFLIIGFSEEERPLEVHEITSSLEGYNENVVMNRAIEFPPEYYQAGLGILSYFHKLLKERYPGISATVKILQDGLVVKMIVETKDGNQHIVEKALGEYDLIIKGEIKPEEYFGASEQIQILELKNELRMAQVRIESQKEMLAFQQTKIKDQEIQTCKLIDILSNGLAKQTIPIINVSPMVSIENSLSQHTIIHNELKEAIESIRKLKQVVDSPVTIEALNEVEEALSEVHIDDINRSQGMSKLQSFLDKVNNVEDMASKSLDTATEGVKLIKKLANSYNKLAPWCGLPQIPFIK